MPLTDLLTAEAPETRPPAVACDHYAPGADGRRCADYAPNGACAP